MKTRGSELVVMALEDEGVKFTFGIPGTHNIELYDALERSPQITPVLVTDEQAASFMADGVSRTSRSVGVVNVVPGAGVSHCISGVAEAFMDNVPMVVLAAGIRGDTGKSFQLHDIDQMAMLRPVTKAVLKPASPAEIYGTVRAAFGIARSGAPGPVAVEIPCEYYLMTCEVPDPDRRASPPPAPSVAKADVTAAARLLAAAKAPLIYAGNGARDAATELAALAGRLGAPVATTIQGKGVFPESHPLWLWNGLGASTPPFVRVIEKRSDCMLAIGVRFSEVGTASYGMTPPANLIHVDIDPGVFNRNYKAALCVASDAGAFIRALLEDIGAPRDAAELKGGIASGHRRVAEDQAGHKTAKGRVGAHAFFRALRSLSGPDTIYTADSGNGMFLAMEHLRVDKPGCFIAPVDYSCMGYAVPAAIGAKMANSGRDVVALEGDGSLLMTGLEMMTAATYRAAPLVCVLRDRELGQIAKFQRRALCRDTCSLLPDYSVEAFAQLTGCNYFFIGDDALAAPVLESAFRAVRGGEPSMVEVAIDYSQDTFFTRGVLATNFWRYPWGERLRLITRVASRKVGG
ncbi:MAG: thiamine pyrophosphate-binding protein [Myxococcota bacterium]